MKDMKILFRLSKKIQLPVTRLNSEYCFYCEVCPFLNQATAEQCALEPNYYNKTATSYWCYNLTETERPASKNPAVTGGLILTHLIFFSLYPLLSSSHFPSFPLAHSLLQYMMFFPLVFQTEGVASSLF